MGLLRKLRPNTSNNDSNHTLPTAIPPVSRVILQGEDIAEIRSIRALIDQYRVTAGVLERGLLAHIYEKFGADVLHEDWTLDLEKGELVRGSAANATE